MPSNGSGNDDDHRSDASMKDHSTMASDSQALISIDTESQAKNLSKEPMGTVDSSAQDTDTDHIGGFVWKFPSEGSNSIPGEETHSAVDIHSVAASYPRKCRHCHSAWVSSYVHERRHWKQCNPEQAAIDNKPTTDAMATLGIPRRVWCEVDSSLTALQWREDVHSHQDTTLNRIPFREMAEIVVLETPSDAFQVTTLCGRRVVFQCRSSSQKTTTEPQNVLDDEQERHHHKQAQEPLAPEQEQKQPLAAVVRALDARQWCEYLQIFSRFTQDQEQTVGHDEIETINPEQVAPVNQYECGDTHSEMLQAITRAIISKDVESLQELLGDDSHEDLAATLALLDDNGSSLLVVAFKLGGDERIVRALIQAGVDCNRQNRDGETPLLLAAASGELELLRVLLSIERVDVNQKCAMGATAFHAAANAGEVDALRMLCEATDERATNVHALDDNGWTALHYAAACGCGPDAMCFLCELMPEFVDYQCTHGNTALHIAAGYGCAENARVLLQTAANPHMANGDGHTAYKVALQNHHIACAMAIHEYMATPRDYYERVAAVEFSQASTVKEDRVAQAEVTTQSKYWRGQHHEAMTIQKVDDSWTYDGAEPTWVEYATEDQIPYYYNTVTGVSTWHKPAHASTSDAQLESAGALPPAAPFVALNPHCDGHNELLTDGHKLPLCMIPLVSPLVSLDDPTAATKLDSRRRKDRERRRSKMQKKLQRHHTESYSHMADQDHDLDPDQTDVWPPPPPPPF